MTSAISYISSPRETVASIACSAKFLFKKSVWETTVEKMHRAQAERWRYGAVFGQGVVWVWYGCSKLLWSSDHEAQKDD